VENNTSCACFIPDNLRYTLRTCNVYGVSTSTVVARTRLDVNVVRTVPCCEMFNYDAPGEVYHQHHFVAVFIFMLVVAPC
jgi:hypothetical protein